jgi:hypothetical protein
LEAVVRNALWVAGLVLIAGGVAFAVVRLGGSDSKPAAQPARENAAPAAETTAPTRTLERAVPVAEEARVAAGQFILWAVSTQAKRADLARAWELVHPELKSECGCTRAEWLTGNIPVQPYPVADLETATFAVNESYADHVVLEVALLPREGTGVESQFFFIGLKAVPAGAKKRWLVYYWAPRQGAEQGVHIAPESG